MSQENIVPNVYVDILLEKDLLFLQIKNNSDVGAKEITVSFNRNMYGVEKKVKINKLNIFKNLLYLAPQKEIKIFVSQIDSFLKYNKTPLYRFRVKYKDESGKQSFSKTIYHDLNIYRDLPIFFK